MPDETANNDQVVETETHADTVTVTDEQVKAHPLYKQVLSESIQRRQRLAALEGAKTEDVKPVTIDEDAIVEKALTRLRSEQAAKEAPKALLTQYNLSPEYLGALESAGAAAESVAKALAGVKRLDSVPTGGTAPSDALGDVAARLRAKYNLSTK